MNKKIMLLALGAVSAMMLAVPAMASAMVPLHIDPTPTGAKTITGVGGSFLSSSGSATKIECAGFGGSATFDTGSSTTGKMSLVFTGCKESALGTACRSTAPNKEGNTIETTPLTFHLATLKGKLPGVLVTPNTDGAFAHISCAGGLVQFTVSGTGVLGTITSPGCGGSSSTATINFAQSAVAGTQNHLEVEGTPGVIYDLKKGAAETAAINAHGTIDFGTNSTLTCT